MSSRYGILVAFILCLKSFLNALHLTSYMLNMVGEKQAYFEPRLLSLSPQTELYTRRRITPRLTSHHTTALQEDTLT